MRCELEVCKQNVQVGVAFANGKYIRSPVYTDEFHFKPGPKVDIAFDQSTSQTGIALKLHGGPVLCIVDFINRGTYSKEVYQELLKMFLESFLKGLDVQYVVYEDPVERSKTVMTRNILMELRGFIKTLAVRIPEMRNATFVEVNIGTWRKHYLKDPIYKGRRKQTELVKIAAMDETLRRFPVFKDYVDTFRKPPDSMDAVGILEGWTSEYFTNSKMETIRINKCMPIIYNLSYYHEIVRISADTMREFLRSRFGAMVRTRGYKVLAYNGDISLEDNALRAASAYNEYCLILITARKDVQAVRWEAKADLQPGEVYAILSYRRELTNTLPLNSLGEEEDDFWRHQR